MAIRLEKSGDTHRINLEKSITAISKEIVINMNWSKGGWLKQIFGKGIDLDLGCYYLMRNGKSTVIDALQFAHGQGGPRNRQTKQGCYTMEPYIWHTGDDKTGGEGETIIVNPKGVSEIKTMLIYANIYDGVARWSESNAVVKIKVPGLEDVIVEMGQQVSDKKFCAIAQLDFNTDNSITVKKLITFHDNHEDCDRRYGWGFNWVPGTKD